jgi:tRNA(Ser,Leu) C12 N-acetylase TAN1
MELDEELFGTGTLNRFDPESEEEDAGELEPESEFEDEEGADEEDPDPEGAVGTLKRSSARDPVAENMSPKEKAEKAVANVRTVREEIFFELLMARRSLLI